MDLIAYLLPIIVIQFLVSIISFIHVLRHPHYKCGNKVLWSIIVLFLSFIGPILYFSIGRGEDE